ncbi:MAG TPA: RNA 2',3'-cyclic phosphodiesterase [Candidatus Hydrogenedentes bacterium]|nr:RNA 2',3'-cyclic phosphodiesterase [Candidatus Hydrogenedentota bacterium]
MRSFIAIELPDSVRDLLAALVARLRQSGAKASWVKAENAHLTLRFLGDVAEHDLNRLAEWLTLAYRECPPFSLGIAGTGAFPSIRRPEVVWVGVAPVEEPLLKVQAFAERGAVHIGLTPETRVYRPHLTVARIRDRHRTGRLPSMLEEEQAFSAGEFEVGHVSLFHSQLTPSGPIYRKLREFPLCSTS